MALQWLHLLSFPRIDLIITLEKLNQNQQKLLLARNSYRAGMQQMKH